MIGFWEDDPPPEPSSLRGAGTTVESLRTSSRYESAPDSALAVIAKDLEVEDEVLETCIEEGRLADWWKGIVDAARRSSRNEADMIGDETSKRRAAEREFQDRMRRDDEAAWAIEGMESNGVDEEGDVMMGM